MLQQVKVMSNTKIYNICNDCKQKCLMFMLKDEIWLSVAELNETLCFDCCQIRLKRNITPEDIKLHKCIITDYINLGVRIARG